MFDKACPKSEKYRMYPFERQTEVQMAHLNKDTLVSTPYE